MILDVAPAARPPLPCLSCIVPLYNVLGGGGGVPLYLRCLCLMIFPLTAAPRGFSPGVVDLLLFGFFSCPWLQKSSSYHVSQAKFTSSGT